MSTIITHKGRVKQIDNTRIQVQIMQASACSACEAKSLCHSAESKEKMIEVHAADAADFEVGQEVMLVGTLSQGLKAVVYAYVIPLILMLAVLFLSLLWGMDEALSALLSIGVLIPYYLIIYLLRHHLTRKFSFTLKHIN